MELSQDMQKMIGEFFRQHSNYEKASKVERYRRQNKYIKPGQILFVGSSLMEQFPIAEMQLGLDLPLFIYNRGIGGYTTSEMLEVMDICVYQLEPKYIFINIGTNDLNDEAFEEEALRSRYALILGGIKEKLPEAQIFLMAYYPINQKVGMTNQFMSHLLKYRTNERIDKANLMVQSLAQEFGARYIDVNDGLKDENGELNERFTAEGMHFYADGYAQVLERLLPILKELR